jgi:hypothetical protein
VKRPAPDPNSPIANLEKATKRAKDESDLSQAEKFAQAAREHGASDDEDAFRGVLRKLAKPKSG